MRILVVEDDGPMAATIKRGLEEEHHTVTTALDGSAGLALAEIYEFDVVVLDVMLPQLTGLDVARRLREVRRSVPILMLTARDSTRDIVAGLDAGADDYLSKPFAFDELVARIRSLAAVDTRLTSRSSPWPASCSTRRREKSRATAARYSSRLRNFGCSRR